MTILTIPTYLPIPEAARKYGLDEARIVAAVKHGKIKAAMIDDTLVIAEDDARQEARPLRKEDLPEWKKHAHLKGIPIWIGEASRKYGIANQTITIWVKRGLIKFLGYDKNRKLIDEADMAYCAEVYSQRKGQGKWLFDNNGLPYKPKTGPLVIA